MYEFSKILGNENIIKNLKNAIKNNTVSHSYIFDGAEKTGKETIAKTFAKLLQCEENGEKKEPCGRCSSCLSFDNGNNPDVIYIKGDKKKLGIEEIREKVIKNTETKPFKHKYKIFIIKNAHTMTIQAQNAILKTIEEPPKFAIFLLLSNNYSLFLPTILSRCILFKIKPLKPNLIEKYLNETNEEIDKINIPIYVAYSEGSIGKAMKMATSKEFLELRNNIINEIKELDEKDLISMYKTIEKIENYKEDIQTVLDIFLLTYRDCIIYNQTKSLKNIIQKDIEFTIKNISKMSIKNLIGKIDAILKAKLYLKQNANFNMTMECLLLKLKEK